MDRDHPREVAASPIARATVSAVLSGRALAIVTGAALLTYVVALVAKGGDTVALTSDIEVFRAAIDPIRILATSWAATAFALGYAGLAAIAAGSAALSWLGSGPRLDPFGARSWVARAASPTSGEASLLRRGLTGWGKALALGALALLITALVLSAHLRGAAQIVAPEGPTVTGGAVGPSPYRWITDVIRPIDLSVFGPDDALRVSGIDLALGADLSPRAARPGLKTGAVAQVEFSGGWGQAVAAVRPWPGSKVRGRYVYLTRFGLAPHIVLTDRTGATIVDGQVLADLLLPSKVESISLDPAPLTLSLAALRSRGPVAAGPPDIVYRATLLGSGGRALASGTLDKAGKLKADGYTLSVPDTGAWARLDIVRDPGIAWAYAAVLVLAASGLATVASRLFPRLERWPDPDQPGAWLLVRPRFTLLLGASRR